MKTTIVLLVLVELLTGISAQNTSSSLEGQLGTHGGLDCAQSLGFVHSSLPSCQTSGTNMSVR